FSADELAYLAVIRLAAASSASFGCWRPSVMFFSADSIDDQKRPISGLLGIGAPSCALAIVAWMFGLLLSSANSALLAGVPSGTSSLIVFRPFGASMKFSMNSTATSRFGEALEVIAPSTPTNGAAFLPFTDGILATPK